jgi:hypothetical protein
MSPKPQDGPGGPRPLFSPLSLEAARALEAYPALLRQALPRRPGLERELPRNIRDLSLSLTADREGGPRPGYLSDPRTLAAYAWYFLPWNLLRLCRLLPGLDLDIPEDGLVRDLGAGPLTLVQALWLSRPDLRRKRLRFVCTDRSRRALELGTRLFAGLAGFDPTAPEAPWRVQGVRGEYWQGLGEGSHLTAMINVANELAGAGREPLAERMERLAGQLADTLAPGGRLLLVEPGTRLGWRCLEAERRALTEMGLGLVAPCPHERPCPLAEGRVRAWCHFITPPQGAPAWLAALSDRAGLAKERLSLSFLLARAGTAPDLAKTARVVSGAFALTDVPGSAVYACSGTGLLVLVSPDRHPPGSGDLLAITPAPGAPVDPKSGAPRLVLPTRPGREADPAGSRPERVPSPGRPSRPEAGSPRAPGPKRPRPAGRPGPTRRGRAKASVPRKAAPDRPGDKA